MDEPDRLQQFSNYLERRAPGRRTTILYVSDVRQFSAVISKPWREITMQDIDTFVDQQRQAKLSPATVKRRVAALRADVERSAVLFDRALEHPLSPQRRVQSLMGRAGLGFFRNDWAQATTDFAAATAVMEECADPEILRLLLIRLNAGYAALPGGKERMDRILGQARVHFGDQISPLRVIIEELTALLHIWRGQLHEAIGAGEKTLAFKERLGGSYPFVGVDAATIVVDCYTALGNYAAAERYVGRLFEGVKHTALVEQMRVAPLFVVARCYRLQGRLDQVRPLYAQICAAENPHELPMDAGFRARLRGMLAMGEGRYTEAARALRQAVSIEQQEHFFALFGSGCVLLAHFSETSGRPDRFRKPVGPAATTSEEVTMNHIPLRSAILILIVALFLAALWAVLLLLADPAGAEQTGITDPAMVVTPAALPRPAVGVTVTDPVFGTALRRVSATSASAGFETHIYSQLQAFSDDNAYLLLAGSNGYVVRRMSDFGLVAGLDSSEWNAPRWHPALPHTLIHYDSNADVTLRVQTTAVDTGQTQTIFTFPAGWARIRGNQSFDELSHDGRWVAGMATRSNGDQTIFALDLQTYSLGAQLSLSGLYAGPCQPDPQWGEVEPDWVGVSPLGRYLVVQWARGGITRCSGQETFDIRSGAFVGRVYDGHQHGDLGVLPDGTTEFFMTFEMYNPNAGGLASIGYRTLPGSATVQEPVYVQVIDWHGAHISCQGPTGVCLVTASAIPEQNGWSAFEGELFLQYTDGRVDRLVHHRSSECGYWVQPRASLSRDGRYAVFASDWGQQTGTDSCDGSNDNLGRGDPYLLLLAEGGGPVITATPTPLPSSTPTRTATPTGPPPPQTTPFFYTTLDNLQTITNPAAGLGGSSNLQAGDFGPGQAGNGANFVQAGRRAIFPAAQGNQKNIDLAKGELSLWYRPAYAAAADDVIHYLLAVGDIYNVPRLTLSEGDRLTFALVDGGWNAFAAASGYRAPLWQAGEWVHIRAFWDSAAADPIRLYVNGARVDDAAAPGGWDLGSGAGQSLFVGAGNGNGDAIANGMLDELLIYPGGLPSATPTVTPSLTPTRTPTATATPDPLSRRLWLPLLTGYFKT